MDPADLDLAGRLVAEWLRGSGAGAERTVVLHDSNKLTLRVLPVDVVARVAHTGREVAQLEVDVARGLAAVKAPIAPLATVVDPGPHRIGGFTVTFWTHVPPVSSRWTPEAVAAALEDLHRALRSVEVETPHMLDRVSEAEAIVADPATSPELADDDRRLLLETFDAGRRHLAATAAPEQLLHGEPHPGNIVYGVSGPRFIDLETVCRGPIEFDVAHLSIGAAAAMRDVDPFLLDQCRRLVLAMVAAWRWDVTDEFPDRLAHGRRLVDLVRVGPPWPAFGAFDD